MSRKLFLLIAILLVGGLAFSGLAFAGSTEIFGQGGFQSTPHRIYRLVHNPNATVVSAERLVIWDLTIDNGVSVSYSTTSGDSAVAGILVEAILGQVIASNTAAEDIGKRNWGLMQTYGLAAVSVASGVGTAGNAMGTSPTAGEAGDFTANTSTSNANGMAGFFYDTAAAGEDEVECFLVLD